MHFVAGSVSGERRDGVGRAPRLGVLGGGIIHPRATNRGRRPPTRSSPCCGPGVWGRLSRAAGRPVGDFCPEATMQLNWVGRDTFRGKTVLTTLDAHSAGEPLRIVTGGLPELPGAT